MSTSQTVSLFTAIFWIIVGGAGHWLTSLVGVPAVVTMLVVILAAIFYSLPAHAETIFDDNEEY